jgi:hypothetical protein
MHTSSFPRRVSPGVLHLVSPSSKRRAQGRPGARMHPWAFARKDCAKARSHRYRRSHTGLPCAVVYGLYALSRVNLADCHPRQPRRQRRRQLGASLWGARTTRFRSSAASALVSQRLHVHRIPASRAVTIAMRPSCSRRDGGEDIPIYRICKRGRPRQIGTTGNLRMADMRANRARDQQATRSV